MSLSALNPVPLNNPPNAITDSHMHIAVGASHWGVGSMPVAIPKEKWLPVPSSYQLPIAPQLEVGPRSPPPHHAGDFLTSLISGRSCAIYPSCCELTCAITMPCISQYSSPNLCLLYSFQPLSTTFPELWDGVSADTTEMSLL